MTLHDAGPSVSSNIRLAVTLKVHPSLCWCEYSPNQTIHHPAQPQRPPDRRIPPQALPAQYKVHTKPFPSHEGREDDEHRSDDVVSCLQHSNLAQDFERGEIV